NRSKTPELDVPEAYVDGASAELVRVRAGQAGAELDRGESAERSFERGPRNPSGAPHESSSNSDAPRQPEHGPPTNVQSRDGVGWGRAWTLGRVEQQRRRGGDGVRQGIARRTGVLEHPFTFAGTGDSHGGLVGSARAREFQSCDERVRRPL